MIYIFLLIIIVLAFISCGGYMIYSAFTGKGIPDPGANSLFQFRIQYKLRGFIGSIFILIGILITIGMFKMF